MSDWRERAACRSADPDLFYAPARAEREDERDERVTLALSYCDICPVRDDCAAFHADDRYAIAGGTLPEQRGGRATRRTLVPHGSLAAYERHRAAGEPPCEDCAEYRREYDRDRYARRQGIAAPENILDPVIVDRLASGSDWRDLGANRAERIAAYALARERGETRLAARRRLGLRTGDPMPRRREAS